MFTQKQANEYVAGGGGNCPHCGSEQIVGGSIEIDAGRAYQEITCQACEASWVDGYTLASVMLRAVGPDVVEDLDFVYAEVGESEGRR